MAQQKELKSPYSAGPKSLSNRSPAQEDFSDIVEDFSDIAEKPATQAQSKNVLSLGQDIMSQMDQRIGAPPTPEQAKYMRLSTGAELLGAGTAAGIGAFAGGAIGAGLGGFVGGPPGLVAGIETGAQLGGFIGGALGTNDAVNFFRKAFSLPEATDRNRYLDVLGAGGMLAGRTGARVAQAITKSPSYIAKTIGSLDEADRTLLSALQQEVFNSAKSVSTEAYAKELQDEVLSDVTEGITTGLGTRGAISFAARRYGAKLDSAKSFDELINKFGQPMTQDEIVAAAKDPRTREVSAARPEDVLDDLGSKYNTEWEQARAVIASNKEMIDKIDFSPILSSLKQMRDSAAFSPKYRAKMSSLISEITNNKAIEDVITSKTLSPEEAGKMVILDAETGKSVPLSELLNKPVRFAEKQVQEGFEIASREGKPGVNEPLFSMEEIPTKMKGEPSAQAAFTFDTESKYFPGEVRKRMTGQAPLFIEPTGPQPGVSGAGASFQSESEQLALQYNQMLGRKKVAALDSLIQMRASLDRELIMSGKLLPDRQAALDTVTLLRNAEDAALQSLASSSNETIASIGQRAQSAKSSVANHLYQVELLGKVPRKDAIGYAAIIDSAQTDPQRVQGFATALSSSPETRKKVAAEMVARRLSEIAKPGPVGLNRQMAESIDRLSKDNDFLAKLEIISGDKSFKKDLERYSVNLKRASRTSGPVAERIAADATLTIADVAATKFNMNPLTWIGKIIPNESTHANRIVNHLFANNKEALIKSIAQDEGAVLDAALKLNKTMGSRAAPIIGEIASRAMREGTLSAEVAAALNLMRSSSVGGQQ
jgi:hypothetical protein